MDESDSWFEDFAKTNTEEFWAVTSPEARTGYRALHARRGAGWLLKALVAVSVGIVVAASGYLVGARATPPGENTKPPTCEQEVTSNDTELPGR